MRITSNQHGYCIIWQKFFARGDWHRSFMSHIESDSPEEALRIWSEKIRSMTTEELCHEFGIFATPVDSGNQSQDIVQQQLT